MSGCRELHPHRTYGNSELASWDLPSPPSRRASRVHICKEPRCGRGSAKLDVRRQEGKSPEPVDRPRQTFPRRSGRQVPDFTSCPWPPPLRAATTTGKAAGRGSNRTPAACICEEATESLESKYRGCSTDRSRLCSHKECNDCTEATKSLSQLSTC